MKIAAVVVTYNRFELLKECIESLRNQTRKLDEIIVINNSSTDGTLDWLKNQKDLSVITQENLGGAGGFHNGMKLAYKEGYDWVWCMDDDGYADHNCLRTLLQYATNSNNIIGSFVIDKTNTTRLAFNCPITKYESQSRELSFNCSYVVKQFPNNIIKDWVVLFNGVLISRTIISKIGFPNKNLFIWGDEFEYLYRIKKDKIGYFTVTTALYYHPPTKIESIDYYFNKEIIINITMDSKFYFLFRNTGYLSKFECRFFNIKYVFAQFIYYFRFKNFRPGLSFFFLRAYLDGIFTKFPSSFN